MTFKSDEYLQEDPLNETETSEMQVFTEQDIFSKDLTGNKDFIFESKKSGLFFPVTVILSVLLISFLIIFISRKIINADMGDFNINFSEKAQLESALMNKFKADTDNKIKVKDKEIIMIRGKLDSYNEQLKTLREIIFTKSRNTDLPDNIEKTEYSGMSISELEKAIIEIEDKKTEEEKKLDMEIQEKSRLVKEMENRKTVTGDNNRLEIIDIAEMQMKLERQKSINTQLNILQKEIFDNIDKRNYEKARMKISNFKTLLFLESNNDLPEITGKRDTSKKTMEVTEEYISLLEMTSNWNNQKINDSPPLVELNILYTRILTDLEKHDFYTAGKNINNLKTYLIHKSNNDFPELSRLRGEYLRTADLMDDYIAVQNEIQNLRTDIKTQPESDNTDNIYSDFSGESLLCGKIASIENKVVSIEMFFDLSIYPGDSFLIKKEETEIARGVIISVSANASRGIIEKTKPFENNPGINNLVYIIRE